MQPRNSFGHLPLHRAPVVAPFPYPNFCSELSAVEPDTHTQDAQDPPFHDQNFSNPSPKFPIT